MNQENKNLANINVEGIEKKTMSIKQLQSVLGLSYHKTMEIVHREDFPKITVGRRILVINSMIDEWLNNNIGLLI